MVPGISGKIGYVLVALGLLTLFGNQVTAWFQQNQWTALAVPMVTNVQAVANNPISINLSLGTWILVLGLIFVFGNT